MSARKITGGAAPRQIATTLVSSLDRSVYQSLLRDASTKEALAACVACGCLFTVEIAGTPARIVPDRRVDGGTQPRHAACGGRLRLYR